MTGDTNLYNKFRIKYYNNANEFEFHSIALIMANKHNYALAHWDIYETLSIFIKDTSKNSTYKSYYILDSLTQNYIYKHLNIASKKGIEEAKNEIKKLNNNIQN